MKPLIKLFILSSCFAVLFGCATAMAPSSDDPEKILGWATVLLEKQDRPLPAERLIREAIKIYQTQNDEVGLGDGYRKYGYFFRSPSVKRWEQTYRKYGFLDKTATFDQRLNKSIEYYVKARDLFTKNNSYDGLSNVDLNLASVYEEKGEREMACKALDSSLANNVQFKTVSPNVEIRLQGNFKSFEELIVSEKRRMQCP